MIAARPVRAANRARNALGDEARRARWRPARDALWALLDRHVAPAATVCVAGAGNADDLPLGRLLARAGRVELCDLDPAAARRALRREPAPLRARGAIVRADVSGGGADRTVRAVLADRAPRRPLAPPEPLPGGERDVVVGDLLYSQLLYPALLDAGASGPRIEAALERYGPALTRSVVERLHATARPGGAVVHLHDALGWWEGHPQPFAPEAVLEAAAGDLSAALELIASGHPPRGCDVLGAVRDTGAPILETALWRWPFREGVDYVVVALVIRAQSTA